MSIDVRRIRPDEAQVLRWVRLAALADRPDAFGSTFACEVAFSDGVWAERAAEGATGGRAAIFFAWLDDSPVGIVAGFRSDDVVDLVSMWTGPTARRQGIGRQLVDAVLTWAEAHDAAQVELWVMRGNDDAQRLYQSMGFVVTDSGRVSPSDPCKDEVRMVRRWR